MYYAPKEEEKGKEIEIVVLRRAPYDDDEDVVIGVVGVVEKEVLYACKRR